MKRTKQSLLLLALTLGVLAPCFSSEAKANQQEIAKGVFAGEVDLSGMNKKEAMKAVEAYVAEKTEETVTLKVAGETLEVSKADLGLTWDNTEVIDEALELGKSGNLIKRYKALKDLEFSNQVYELSYEVDEELITTIVSEQCTRYNTQAKDLGLKKTDSGFEIVEGEAGIAVDEEAAADRIAEDVKENAEKENLTIELPTKTVEPKGSREELEKVKDKLGGFSTSYRTSGTSRSKNISTGAGHIDGTVVYPGETFSTYDLVKPFSVDNGYAMAGSYLNGKVVDSLGGGICQVSSTLYNAVLLAELEVVERNQHSMMVGYVQASADAAISESAGKDFKFKNNTDAPIYIEGYTTSDKKIVFNIYGEETRPSNRTVKYTNKVLETTPAVTQLVADGGQGIGYRVVESGHNGCKAELYKEVYVDGVLKSSEKVNKSSYKTSNRTVYYGINGDPALSAQLQQCIAAGDEAGANALLGI